MKYTKKYGERLVSKIDTRVIEYLAKGMTYKKIAEEMNLSYHTIHGKVCAIKLELDAKTITHVVSIAYQKGILKINP